MKRHKREDSKKADEKVETDVKGEIGNIKRERQRMKLRK
jgi:hypothetical protein